MDLKVTLILLVTGLVSGFINTVAGGGSLLTLPVFIFLGFDANVANATNRVAVVSQSVASMYGFRKNGVFDFRYSAWLGISSIAGAIIGTILAVKIKDDTFNLVLAVIMLVVSVFIIFNPFQSKINEPEIFDKKRNFIGFIVFFFIGIYGGFIQAGVGFLIIAALVAVNNMSLVKSNSIKVTVVFLYTVVSLIIFMWNGLIDWKYGLMLAAGQAVGGYAGSHWSVSKGDIWIRRVMLAMIVVMALKLLGVPFLNPSR